MRTEEEAKYDLDQTILEMYDAGSNVQSIARKLSINADYVMALLDNTPVERYR